MNRRPRFPTQHTIVALSLLVVMTSVGCRDVARTTSDAPRVVALENSLPEGSAQPGLSITPDGRVYLSWLQQNADSTFTLRYVVRDTSTWSAPREVITTREMRVSATDVPSVHEVRAGRLVAAWRRGNPKGYDVVVSHSEDNGATWSTPASPHHDGTSTEHGFVSWVALNDVAGMVWLDGRNNASSDSAARATQLAYATFDSTGAPTAESFIEPKICDCCHTSSASIGSGTIVAYRDRADGEIRDISVIRGSSSGWRAPVSVHADGWHYAGCPVNGPAISARDSNVAVSWYTAARDTARVRLAFSHDSGASFGAPVEINESFPDGRVGVVLTKSGDALVSWIERRDQTAVLRLKRVTPTGSTSPAFDVATLGDDKRAGGQPKLVAYGDGALLAWADAATKRVKTIVVRP